MANKMYKTELCKNFEETGFCRYSDKCQFAHSRDELRQMERHPLYKTETCRNFSTTGHCKYGKRCCFLHIREEISDTASTHSKSYVSQDEKENIVQCESTPFKWSENKLVNEALVWCSEPFLFISRRHWKYYVCSPFFRAPGEPTHPVMTDDSHKY